VGWLIECCSWRCLLSSGWSVRCGGGLVVLGPVVLVVLGRCPGGSSGAVRRALQVLGDVLPHRSDGERSGQAQGPGERPPLLGEVDAREVEVHGCAPARQAPDRVGDEDVSDRDHTQQSGLRRLGPAAHTGALRASTGGRLPL
jgi:hypothetical protein